MRILKVIATLAMILPLAACATGPRVNEMTAAALPADVGEQVFKSPLLQSVSVGNVTEVDRKGVSWEFVGTEDFKKALEQSLRGTGLLSPTTPAKYLVDVELVDTDQPIVGFDMSVTSTVGYTITDTSTKTAVFKTQVVAPHTADFSSAFVGAERARLANEGSIKKNIEQFLSEAIRAVKPGAPSIPAATPTS